MYFYPLNIIRFLLALGVILFHYGINYFPFDVPPLKTIILNSAFRVSFFFFISGFVMSLVYDRQGVDLKPRRFYWRRFSRIYPVYLFAFVITLLVVVLLKGAAPKGLNILLHALGLQSLNPGYVLDLNYPTWSISVELVFYLLFPFLLRWTKGISLKRITVVTWIMWLLQSLQHIFFVEFVYTGTKASEEFISTFPLWHLPTFFAGMTVARLTAQGAIPQWVRSNALSCFFLTLLLFVLIVSVPNPVLKYIHNGLLSPLFGLMIVSLYHDRSAFHRLLSNPLLSRLGDLSYGLFIFQYPVWVICTTIAGEPVVKTTSFFLYYLAILVVFSWAMNTYFEKPLMRRLRAQSSIPVLKA